MTEEIQYPEAVKYPEYDSASFEINILSMKTKEVNSVSNVVYCVDYEIVATLASGTVRKFECSLDYTDEALAQVETFTPYNDLLKTDIEQWIESYTDVENIKRGLTMPENTEDAPVPLPWETQ